MVRKNKLALLPCELFGLTGKHATQCAKCIDEVSLIEWKGIERGQEETNY